MSREISKKYGFFVGMFCYQSFSPTVTACAVTPTPRGRLGAVQIQHRNRSE